MKLPKFPYVYELRGVKVVVVRQFSRVGKKRYRNFSVRFYERGRLYRQSFSDFEKAKQKAESVAISLVNQESRGLTLSNDDTLVYRRSKDNLSGTGLELDQVSSKFVEMRKFLDGADPIEAACFWAKHHRGIEKRSVGQVYDELLADLASREKSKRHIDDVRLRIGAFNKQCEVSPITSITASDIRDFLLQRQRESKSFSARSYNNFVRALRLLFRFAKNRRYVGAEFDEHERVQLMDADQEKMEFYRPREINSFLDNAKDQDLLFIAIGAFAGLRTSEFLRLEWEDFQWDTEPACIIIRAVRSTKSEKRRRIVPIFDNLKKWIQRQAKRSGKLWPHSGPYLYERMADLCKRANTPWKDNGLRHSFISYRLAQTKDKAKVAHEAGTSPAKIESNYDAVVTPQQAELWFSIVPLDTAEQKILNLKFG